MEYSLELMLPVPIPLYFESQEDTALLWRREFLLPNPRLKHVMLREDSTEYRSCDLGGS